MKIKTLIRKLEKKKKFNPHKDKLAGRTAAAATLFTLHGWSNAEINFDCIDTALQKAKERENWIKRDGRARKRERERESNGADLWKGWARGGIREKRESKEATAMDWIGLELLVYGSKGDGDGDGDEEFGR